jgi:hypothetical protein
MKGYGMGEKLRKAISDGKLRIDHSCEGYLNVFSSIRLILAIQELCYRIDINSENMINFGSM